MTKRFRYISVFANGNRVKVTGRTPRLKDIGTLVLK
jgi:hypothetical protein